MFDRFQNTLLSATLKSTNYYQRNVKYDMKMKQYTSQWTHLHRFAIDSTSKFHAESSSRFYWFWKTNPCGNYDIDSMGKFWRGFNFQNQRNIDEFSTWIFLCPFKVESTQLLYSLFPFYHFLTFSALKTYSKLIWYSAESM